MKTSPSKAGKNIDAMRVWLRIMACNNLIQSNLRSRFQTEFSTTLPRFDILAQIDRAPQGPTMSELSKRLMVTKANITDLMGRLEADEMVYRRKSDTDARISHVYLTPKGKKELDKMAKAHKAWLDELMQDLRACDIRNLYESLGTLKATLKLRSKE